MTAYPLSTPDPTNVVGRRILAYGIDLLIMFGLGLAVLVPAFQSASETVSADRFYCANLSSESRGRTPISSDVCIELGDDLTYIPAEDDSAFTSQMYAVLFGLQALNLVVLQGLTGASAGKLLVGLRVIRQDGQRAGIGWAALRWILLFVDSFCCFLPGAVLVFATKGHRRLGDMAASTFVVRAADVGRPPQVPGVTAPLSTPAAGAWGAPPAMGGGTWGPPVGASGPSAPPADGPIWDDARDTYIQYDRSREAWVQWDAATSQWMPIDQ